MTTQYGIEKLRVFPGTLSLDIATLCAERGSDFEQIRRTLMTDERSVLAPWEDAVTMAVNAADGLLDEDDRRSVELLIVGTETAVDQEKPVSTWVHRWLGLASNCRNFEIKHGCYSATAGMRMALAWLREQGERPCRALVVAADTSLPSIGEPFEPIAGTCASAMLLSNRPGVLVPDVHGWGVYSNEVSDIFRPALDVETGNSETSLFAYIDALEGAYADYARRTGGSVDIDGDFAWHIYHLPFAGMALRAHRTLMSIATGRDRRQANESYLRKVEPSLSYSRRIGSSFGSSFALALLSLLDQGAGADNNDRFSVFSYGSGSCAEFYGATFGDKARQVAATAGLSGLLDRRRQVSVAEYEACERQRIGAVGQADFTPGRGLVGDWFEERYTGSGMLVLDRIENYYRHYRRA